MRLTLRTLLAYLDDTLGAAEIKTIGEKVAESDAAQELVARIKQVTRRRRLTTPPSAGPGAFDPNDAAEYLDNELESERIAELEKQCLESDVHLAEIAACHQILTLVLGEPALVPPNAKERMYKLVKSRESIPFRKATPTKKANVDGLNEEEELELGSNWLRWVLPVASLLLVAALSVAVYSILQKPTRPGPIATGPDTTKDKDKGKGVIEPEDTKKDDSKPPVVTKDAPPKDMGKTTPPDKDGTPKDGGKSPTPEPVPPSKAASREAPPSTTRREIGTYVGPLADQPSVLARRTAEGWQALPEGAIVHSTDTLTALPGFSALIRTNRGVGLTLRGHVPPFSLSPMMNLLQESSVILHTSDEFDLDLTLLRGRIYIRNQKDKGPAKVRLRFEKEVWDLTFPLVGDEVGIDLFKEYAAIIDHLADPPHASAFLFLTRGEVQLSVDAFHTHTLEAEGDQSMLLMWDSRNRLRNPQRLKALPEFNKTPPTPEQLEGARKTELRETQAALKNLQTLISGKRDKVGVALKETLGDERVASRLIAIYGLAALDDPDKLVDVLGDELREHAADRSAALFALRHWLAGTQNQYRRLYDKDKGTGILLDRKYKPGEAKAICDLLFDLSPETFSKLETFEELKRGLQHRRIAIAELSMWHLAHLSRPTKLPPGFNAAATPEEREKYAEKINEMISKRLLPPAPAAP